MEDEIKANSSSCKRKQPDEDEVLLREVPLIKQPIENEYEHFDDDDDVDDDETVNKKEAEYEQILRAQEPATITQYDDIKITPFNLEEELEEGEFDKTGNFVFKKESDVEEEENDTWAESIDWSAVEQREREQEKKTLGSTSGTNKKDSLSEPVRDRITCYKQMLRIMKPEETIQKTIRRLGNDVPKRGPKSSQPIDISESIHVATTRRKLDLMIELAHQRLEDGDTDIYQKSFEYLEEAIN